MYVYIYIFIYTCAYYRYIHMYMAPRKYEPIPVSLVYSLRRSGDWVSMRWLIQRYCARLYCRFMVKFLL